MDDNEIGCAFCRSAHELLSGRPVVVGYEIRHYACPKCGQPIQIVARIEQPQPVMAAAVPACSSETDHHRIEPARAPR